MVGKVKGLVGKWSVAFFISDNVHLEALDESFTFINVVALKRAVVMSGRPLVARGDVLDDCKEPVGLAKLSFPHELVKVLWDVIVASAVHPLQLSLHSTPEAFDSVGMHTCERVNEVLRVVHRQVKVSMVVQRLVRSELIRVYSCSRQNVALYYRQ